MSEFAAQVAEVLRAQSSGNNDRVRASIQALEAMRQDSQNYCAALCEIIEKDLGLRPVALTDLNRCFGANFEQWPGDFQARITEQIVNVSMAVSSLSEVLTVAEMLVRIYKSVGSFPGLDIIFEPGKRSQLMQLSVAERILREPELLVLACENLEPFTGIALRGLNGNWDQIVISMKIISCLVAVDETFMSHVLEPLMSLVEKSLELDETTFLGFWSDLNGIVATADLPENAVAFLFGIAQKIAEKQNLGAFAKLSAFQCICSKAEKPPIDLVLFSLKIVAAVQDASDDIESPISDICEIAISSIGADSFFQLLQKFGSEGPENLSICLVVLALRFSQLWKQIKANWTWCRGIIETMGNTPIPIVQENICRFLAALDGHFESELAAAGLFLQFVVPMVLSTSPEVRHHAREAIYCMVDKQTSPVTNLVASVWSINGQVRDESATYLTLFAKCLENEGEHFSSQSIAEMSSFVIPFLQSGDENVITGALSVAAVLLCSDEDIADMLGPPTVHAIFQCLMETSKDDLVMNGLKRIADLSDLIRDMILADTSKLELIAACLQLDNEDVVRMAVLAVCSLMPGVPFVDTAFQFILKQIEENNVTATDITSLSKLSRHFPVDKLHMAFTGICERASKSKDEDCVIDCVDGLSSIVHNVKDETLMKDAILLACSFIDGKIALTEGESPLESSPDVVNSFTGLICELLSCKSDANRSFFGLAVKMCEGGEDLIDTALCIFGEGVSVDAFIEQEMKFVVELLGSLLKPETSVELMHSCSYLLSVMLKKGLLLEEANVIWQVLSVWFQRLSDIRSMGTALANVASAFWVLALRLQKVDSLLASSLSLFPPDDLGETVSMCEMLAQMGESGQMMQTELKYQVVAAITRLLCLSRMFQKRRQVDDNTRAHLGNVLKQLCSGDQQAQAVMAEVVGDSPNRRRRIEIIMQ